MTSSHVPVALSNGPGYRQVTVLPIHVVRARPGVVPQPDAEVLDLDRCLLGYLLNRNDLPRRLLELLQLSQKVPESGLGDNLIRREYPHLVERRALLLFGGELAPNHLEFLQLEATGFHEKM